jgi:acyl-CoA reductase-like NAD-dependent aldehyde dehydrogenase
MAEMLEGRKAQFIDELMLQDSTRQQATREIDQSIDRLIYYAGWADKYQQIISSVNAVSSAHFNFSVCEPMGVVGIIAPQNNSLLGLVSVMAPVIAGGNTSVIVASQHKPLCSVTFAEVLNSSDLPGGVVNILTGKPEELIPWMADHLDANAIIYCEKDPATIKSVEEKASGNLKRVIIYNKIDWKTDEAQSPYFIQDTQEIKTTWHPIEKTGSGGSKY